MHVISYTSGTTGDPKGVKLCHFNVLAAARSTGTRAIVNPGDPIISYLPYTHSYEQGMMAFSIFRGMKIGYY